MTVILILWSGSVQPLALRGRHKLYLMYVDESGDIGLNNSPSSYFVLTGLVVHELRWRLYLDQLIDFRKRLNRLYGLGMRDEIHAAHFITRPGALARTITRNNRLAILRNFADELASMAEMNIINIVVNKPRHYGSNYDVFNAAWRAPIQRFENTMSYRNFPGPANPDERGMIFPDHTDDKKLTKLLRQMRRWNPTPHSRSYSASYGVGYRNMILTNIIEDPNFRNSEHSYFIQGADLAAFLLYQRLAPNAYMRRTGGHNYFSRIDPILCKVASGSDPQGIAYL
jgi:hypothetical protein